MRGKGGGLRGGGEEGSEARRGGGEEGRRGGGEEGEFGGFGGWGLVVKETGGSEFLQWMNGMEIGMEILF